MRTTLHEGRHAYQDDIVNGRCSLFDNSDTVDIKLVLNSKELWKQNWPTHEYGVYYESNVVERPEYRYQPIEADANDYAIIKMNSFFDELKADPNYGQNQEECARENLEDYSEALKYFKGQNPKQVMAQRISSLSHKKQNQIEQAKKQSVVSVQEAGAKYKTKRDVENLDKVNNRPDKQPLELKYDIKSLTEKQAKINKEYQDKKPIRKQPDRQKDSQSDVKGLDKVTNPPDKQPQALNFSIKSLTEKQAKINKEYQNKKPIRKQQQDMHR